MRLSQVQVEYIRKIVVEVFGQGAQVMLFGSRVDDNKRGGDIDLLIRPAHLDGDVLGKKIRFLARLERLLGERKVDVVIEHVNDTRPIVQIAHQSGIML